MLAKCQVQVRRIQILCLYFVKQLGIHVYTMLANPTYVFTHNVLIPALFTKSSRNRLCNHLLEDFVSGCLYQPRSLRDHSKGLQKQSEVCLSMFVCTCACLRVHVYTCIVCNYACALVRAVSVQVCEVCECVRVSVRCEEAHTSICSYLPVLAVDLTLQTGCWLTAQAETEAG